MADIAQIGFAANTAGLQQAVTALNKLPPAAVAADNALTGAADALTDVANAGAQVSKSVPAAQKVLGDVGVSAGRAATANDNFAKGSKKASDAAKGLSFDAKNLSYQLVDVAQGLGSGQPLFQIFAQQAGQIGQVLATSEKGAKGLFGEIFKGIASVLTPMRLLTLGIIGAAIALVTLATNAISSAKQFDDLARSIDVSTTSLHGLQQAASFKGISTDDFAAGMKSFADSVYNAQRNMGDLNGLMIANNMQAKTFEQYLGNVADLVARTTSDQQKLKVIQAAGLPATMDWVRFLSQGKAGIAAAVAETVKFNASAEANLVQKARDFDDAWNKSTTKLSNNFKSFLLDGANAIDKIGQAGLVAVTAIGAVLAVALAPFSLFLAGFTAVVAAAAAAKALLGGSSSDTASGRPRVIINGGTTAEKPSGPPAKTQAELLKENADAQARISILGDLATVEQQVAQKQLEITAANLNGVGPSDKMTAKILLNTQALAEMNKVQQQAAAGIYNQAAAQKAATDTLQNWINHGLVDATNVQQMTAARNVLNKSLRDTADAAAVAASAFPQLKQAELDAGNGAKLLDTALTTSFNNMVSPIQDLVNGVSSIGDTFKKIGVIVVGEIQKMIIKMLILKPLMSLFDGGTGIGGLLGGLFSSKSAKGNVFANDNIQRFANGGTFTNQVVSKPTAFAYGAGMGLMGEAGPEAIMPLKRGSNGSLGVQMYGAGGSRGGGSGGSMQIDNSAVFHLGGSATQEDINNIKKVLAERDQKFAVNVANTVQELRRRNNKV